MDLVLKNDTGNLFTVAQQIIRREGILGFWKGNALNVLRTAPFKGLNFFSYEMYCKLFVQLAGKDTSAERFAAGASAGITATLVCFPLDVLRTRLMANGGRRYGGPFATLHGIFKYEGIGALYAGCVPAVVAMAPAGAVFYGVYDSLKSAHLAEAAAKVEEAAALRGGAASASAAAATAATVLASHQQLPAACTLLYGATAGAAAEVIVYPLEVVRRRMQLQSMAAAATPRAMQGLHAGLQRSVGVAVLQPTAVWQRVAAACMCIVQTDGLRGFYMGMVPNMLQVLPSAALSFYVYDSLKNVMQIAPLKV